MIYNQWYGILDSKEVKTGKPVGVKRANEQLVLWRDSKGSICCVSDKCCHRGAALSAGKLVGNCVECPFHGLLYGPSGKVTLIPANGKNAPVPENFKVRGWRVRDEHGFIWLWYGDDRQDLPPLPFFEDIDSSYLADTLIDPWSVHYSRAIENQLDVVHLPFVHYNTIGRGSKTLVFGPPAEISGNQIKFWFANQVDEGQKPTKPEETKVTGGMLYLRFRFPNIWQNHLSDKAFIVACFAPVDEENTMIYIRFYQKFLTAPVIGPLVSRLSRIFNKIILYQDKRVVLTQVPKKTSLQMGENLFQGDYPIMIYRRIRNELIEKNKKA